MAINQFFESLMSWKYDSGIFYISGRDIASCLVGFLLCLILWMTVSSLMSRKVNNESDNKN